MSHFPFKAAAVFIATAIVVALLLGVYRMMQKPEAVSSDPHSGHLPSLESSNTSRGMERSSSSRARSFSQSRPGGAPSLETTAERQDYYDRLVNEPSGSGSVWMIWQQALSSDDDVWLALTGHALAFRLQKERDDSIYNDAAGLLEQPSLSVETKAAVVTLLSETATPEALDVMLRALSEHETDPTFAARPALLNGLKTIGDELWDSRFHTELSPALESAWADMAGNADGHIAIAVAIATIGAPSGVNLLLTDIAERNPEHDPSAYPLLQAIGLIRNPSALTILDGWLKSGRLRDQLVRDTVTEVLESLRSIPPTKDTR